ncbi:putative 2-aminoethylphosphonate ABC transporter ATP-binding protein [Usitatibacter palustris]|uniref:Sulfate/thiosulfate import ATP-binding protein CysA n=1 Tax=Usitatibacter palustris TaxID=2732487 RepID=A0A6M4H8P5_9PROT|nr:putative 2-aminoethylphosphonate ABC transporter ATP-binding protein [Usitatibacter palustris]QJR14377.1 Sulfate/thiosulfate import ATP-binding protein CysA [Usitatibacter palustris]
MTEFLELRDIRKEFGSFTALKGVSLAVHPGELVCFLGPSGCGKTTLLRIIAGLEVQTSGTVIQAGKDISRLPPMKRDYGIVFQSYALFPNLSIAENVAYGLVNRGMARAQRDARVNELLALVGLPDSGAKFPAQLSGGQQQRIAIARAIATSPGLLLLDEPLSALDARVRVRLRGEIRSLQQRLGITTILVTHDQEEALSMADRIVVMNQGVIDQIGSPTEVYRNPQTPFVADFVGKTNLLPATRAGDKRVMIGAQRFEIENDAPAGNGSGLRVFFRPEDVIVRGVGGATPNSAAAVVEKVEFLGSYSRLTFRMNGIDQPLFADLSVNDMEEFHVKPGDTMRVAIPADRVRVFEAQPA